MVIVFVQYDWPDVSDDPAVRESKMLYKFEYLPAGLFNRGQVTSLKPEIVTAHETQLLEIPITPFQGFVCGQT